MPQSHSQPVSTTISGARPRTCPSHGRLTDLNDCSEPALQDVDATAPHYTPEISFKRLPILGRVPSVQS
jgi:hypothetical protein